MPVAISPAAQLANVDLYEQKRSFDFLRLWHSVRERLWVLIICVVAGLVLAVAYLARTPKLYQGHTVLEVEFQEPNVVPADEPSSRTRSVGVVPA